MTQTDNLKVTATPKRAWIHFRHSASVAFSYHCRAVERGIQDFRIQGTDTFGTAPGIFRGPGNLRMPRVKIGIQVESVTLG